MDDDNIWDENRWEAYLRERDKYAQHYMRLFFDFLALHPPPQSDDSIQRDQWLALWARYLTLHGLRPDQFPISFLFDDDHREHHEVWLDAIRTAGVGEEGGIADLSIYTQTQQLALEVLAWSNTLSVDLKDSTLVQFCNALLLIPAQLAKGHQLGFDREQIGGNIACCKRALKAANDALKLLGELRHADCMDPSHYMHVYEATYEARNAVGLYIQQLRNRFNLGID